MFFFSTEFSEVYSQYYNRKFTYQGFLQYITENWDVETGHATRSRVLLNTDIIWVTIKDTIQTTPDSKLLLSTQFGSHY
jgi:hypothetical protein